jgi:hypothetical protein
MARIETYTPDYVITPNDKLIGTDGDNSNATKNFPVIAMLDYLGTNFNLHSADLVYNYTIGDENILLDGQFTSNNRLDVTPLFAGITTLYVSKTTVFGRLIDDYIQTVSDETYSFMIYDFGNYNNFGFYNIVSAVSLDADTFTLTVTFNSGNGSLQDGLSHGLKVYPPTGGGAGDNLGDHIATQSLDMAQNDIINIAAIDGERINLETAFGFWGMGITVAGKLGFGLPVGALPAGFASLYTMDGSGSPVNPTDIITLGDLSNFVTTNTVQNITDYKTFSGGILIDDSLAFIKRLSNITSSSQGIVYFKTDNTFNVSVGTGVGAHNATFDGIDAFTVARTFTLPDANGTFALEGDFVDLTTSQIIAGEKVFTDPTSIESLVFTQNGDSFLVPFGVQHNNTLGFTFQDNTLGGGQCFSFLGQGLTANRVQTIQDKDGTIAHLDDIPAITIPYRGS